MAKIKIFLSAVLAGLCVSIGGMVFLSADNKVVGAAFFTVGLFTICGFGLSLFTGKVCYVFEKGGKYAAELPVIWVGNLVGAWLTAQLHLLTRHGAMLREKAAELSAVKTNDGLLSVFILAVFCNMLIYIAVEGFNKNPHELGKYLSLFLGVMVFIFCGFEHCVANMYYFSLAGIWGTKALLYIVVMTLGNAVGGVSFPLMQKILETKKD